MQRSKKQQLRTFSQIRGEIVYRQRGSLQLFSSQTASTRSLPQVFFPALLGYSRKVWLPPQALRTELSVLHEEPGAIKCNRICAKENGRFGETFGVSRVRPEGETTGGLVHANLNSRHNCRFWNHDRRASSGSTAANTRPTGGSG